METWVVTCRWRHVGGDMWWRRVDGDSLVTRLRLVPANKVLHMCPPCMLLSGAP